MESKYKEFKWDKPTKFEKQVFINFDFTQANFDGVLFIECDFNGCIFKKCTPGSLGIFGSNFTKCNFESFDFRRISVGANGGTFESCIFEKCNFSGRHFEYPHFELCIFDRCKIKNVNFNDASFSKTKFIGKIEDSTFNGLYHKKSTGHKIIDQVDFSEAIFGDFLTFENCDLSNSTPPKGKSFGDLLYQIYSNDPTTLSTGSSDRIVLTKG
jgi:fluoroquinolone resistance protein